ncbi:MAG: hypothetical protein WCH11_00910, partial [Bdellovibrio sp.]
AKSAKSPLDPIQIRKQWQVKEIQALHTQDPSRLQFHVKNKCPNSIGTTKNILVNAPRTPTQVYSARNVSSDPVELASTEQVNVSDSQMEGPWILTDDVLEPMGWHLGFGFGTSLGQTYTQTQSGLIQLTYSPWAVAGFGMAHRVFRNEIPESTQVFERVMDLQGLQVQTARVNSSQHLFAEVRPILGKFNLFGMRQVDTGLSFRWGLIRRNLASGGYELGTLAGAFFEIFGPHITLGLGTLLESSNLSAPSSSNFVGDGAEWLIRMGIPLGESHR